MEEEAFEDGIESSYFVSFIPPKSNISRKKNVQSHNNLKVSKETQYKAKLKAQSPKNTQVSKDSDERLLEGSLLCCNSTRDSDVAQFNKRFWMNVDKDVASKV